MIFTSIKIGIARFRSTNLINLAVFCLSALTNGDLRGELATLNVQGKWGFFAVYESKKIWFAVERTGSMVIQVMGDSENPLKEFKLQPYIGSATPSGITYHSILPASIESPDGAIENLKKTVIRGSGANGSRFEMFIEADRNELILGGRVTDQKDNKVPGHLSLSIMAPSFYVHDLTEIAKIDDSDRGKEKVVSSFEKRIRRDAIRLSRFDGTQIKYSLSDIEPGKRSEIISQSLREIGLEMNALQDRKLIMKAINGTKLDIVPVTNTIRPLHEGFCIRWSNNDNKNTAEQANLTIEVR
jgi:hypothetical protein